jgi:hypothetical protein
MLPIANMLLLLSLPTRIRKGIEPLVDYSKFHVVILNQYLGIVHQKAMQKEVATKKGKPEGKKRKPGVHNE